MGVSKLVSRQSQSVYLDSLADMRRSVVSTYGCVSCCAAVEDPLEPANAYRREDRCRCCHESGNTVSSWIAGLKTALT